MGKIEFPETQPTTNIIAFFGGPNTAPPGSIIRITNLDDTNEPVVIDVDAEGAFSATLSVAFNDELRFQVVKGNERLTPIDLRYTGRFEDPLRIDCFAVALTVEFGATAGEQNANLTIQNDCAADAAVTNTAFRTNAPEFALTQPPGEIILGGAAETVGVSFTGTIAGDNEEVFLLSVQVDGVDARYPVTLHGVGQ